MTDLDLGTPRGSLRLTRPAPDRIRLTLDAQGMELAEHLRETVAGLRAVTHPALAPLEPVSGTPGDGPLEFAYRVRPTARPVASSEPVHRILAVGASVAAAFRAYERGTEYPCFGYLHPRLVLADDEGVQIVGLGLWSLAYELDASTTGRVMTVRHFVSHPPRRPRASFYLAYALYELLCGHEPFRKDDEQVYYRDVLAGRVIAPSHRTESLPADVARLLVRALSAVEEPPTLEEMGSVLERRTPV